MIHQMRTYEIIEDNTEDCLVMPMSYTSVLPRSMLASHNRA